MKYIALIYSIVLIGFCQDGLAAQVQRTTPSQEVPQPSQEAPQASILKKCQQFYDDKNYGGCITQCDLVKKALKKDLSNVYIRNGKPETPPDKDFATAQKNSLHCKNLLKTNKK